MDVQKEIEYIKNQLINKYKPQKIILFGSAAWGKNPNDLDFLIIKKDVPYYGTDRMMELDGMIDRNMAVDMLVYKPEEYEERLKLGDPFVNLIQQKGEVLYG